MPIADPSGRIRLVVVDDFTPFRKALFQFFREFKEIEVVGEAADGTPLSRRHSIFFRRS
jgi:DNA-binding NarL/FixJ family response regulator